MGTYNLLHIEIVSITVVPYYTVITRDVPVEHDCNTITVLLLLLFQINNQSINQSIRRRIRRRVPNSVPIGAAV